MKKDVLIISTSLRKNSNSNTLADAFMDGAKEAGTVFAGGVNGAGEIKGHQGLDEAYKMGLKV